MTLHAHVAVALDGFRLDVGLHAEPGEVVAVVGPNGAGKTTLLRALAGLLPLAPGTRIELDGQVLDQRDERNERDGPSTARHVPPHRRPVGFVFQDLRLFDHLDALDNVAFGLRCRGTRRHLARHRAAAWLDRVGLADRAHARPSQLSRGQAQRVALARALVTEPRLLLLDEPSSGLSDGEARQLATVIRALNRQGATVVLIEHSIPFVRSLADDVMVLCEGQLLAHGSCDETFSDPAVIEAYLGPELVVGAS